MQLRKSERKKAKIKMAMQGPSGSGKTMSALLLAKGLVNDWSKIAIIDTENSSADLYAHLGMFNVLPLAPQFTPERYIKAIQVCEKAGMEVIIIDSISHEWEGTGGILDAHSNMTGNSFTNWGKLTPRHNTFIQKILQSNCHIIGTIRSKQAYVLTEKNGKHIPEKVGLKGVTREGLDYEFTLVFELDLKHNAKTSKDRTGLFMDKPPFSISEKTGERIIEWCNAGTDLSEAKAKILACKSLEELKATYNQYTDWFVQLEPDFKARKQQLTNPQIINHKISNNGITNFK